MSTDAIREAAELERRARRQSDEREAARLREQAERKRSEARRGRVEKWRRG